MTELEARFRTKYKADLATGCWIWMAACTGKNRYGVFSVNRKNVFAHRYSYSIAHGPIPLGMFVCHKCDNPPCVNPDHLFLGTHTDNMRDARNKGRLRVPYEMEGHIPWRRLQTMCKRGHPFDEKNTYVMRDGRRQCRACHNAKTARRYRALLALRAGMR